MKRILPLATFVASLFLPTAVAQTSAPSEMESDCSISVNGTEESFIEPGLPAVFDAYLFVHATDKAATPILKITDANHAVQHWPLKSMEVAQRADDEMRVLKWTLDLDSTKSLGGGKYFVTIALIKGEQTLVESAPAVVNVVPEGSENLSEDEGVRIRRNPE